MRKELVFLLEEKSAKIMLETITQKLFNDEITTRFIVFEGKSHLDKRLSKKLLGYDNPKAVFVILRDQDSADCSILKNELKEEIPPNRQHQTVVRIACHELESFYLGDLNAVGKGYEMEKLKNKQMKAPYRTPDNLTNPKERLKTMTSDKYQPIDGSRKISPHLNLSGENKSNSFQVLLKSIKKF